MRKYYIFSLLLAAFYLSCNKEVGDVNADFIGEWKNSSIGGGSLKVISLDASHGSYSKCEHSNYGAYYDCETIIEGKATIKGEKLRIGIRKFHIDQEPVWDGSNNRWTIVVDKVTYQRIGNPPGAGGGPVPCTNNIKDPGEYGIDCGGSCRACMGYVNYTLDSKILIKADYAYASAYSNGYSFDCHNKKIDGYMEPVMRLALNFSLDSLGKPFPLDSNSLFEIAPGVGVAYTYVCTNGIYEVVQKDTVNKKATIKFNFSAYCADNARTISIGSGVISDWIYSQ